jgi:hypothetical protein
MQPDGYGVIGVTQRKDCPLIYWSLSKGQQVPVKFPVTEIVTAYDWRKPDKGKDVYQLVTWGQVGRGGRREGGV